MQITWTAPRNSLIPLHAWSDSKGLWDSGHITATVEQRGSPRREGRESWPRLVEKALPSSNRVHHLLIHTEYGVVSILFICTYGVEYTTTTTTPEVLRPRMWPSRLPPRALSSFSRDHKLIIQYFSKKLLRLPCQQVPRGLGCTEYVLRFCRAAPCLTVGTAHCLLVVTASFQRKNKVGLARPRPEGANKETANHRPSPTVNPPLHSSS